MKATATGEHAVRTLAAARIVSGVKVYGHGVTAVRALDGITADFTAGKFTRDHGAVRVGKVNAAALPGGP